jgi:CRP-like cAMP-binding protein
MMECLSPRIKDILYAPDEPIEWVYFPSYGVASLLAVIDDTLVEVGTVGNEGMVGIPVFLGATHTNGKSFWQIEGELMRMPSSVLREEVARNAPLVGVLQRYTQALFTMLAQHVACNRLHPINQRCARWLLMTHDRVAGDNFVLTQEFLSQMLGVRRAGVNEVMRALQEAGLVHYRRALVTIVDRAGLEQEACNCYFMVRDEYERMLG